jgi:nucleoside 2-deoxyribosyltransferase
MEQNHSPTLAEKVVYLSGKITGCREYLQYFQQAREQAIRLGARQVFNPADFPLGWQYDHYMEHCMILVRRADVVLALANANDSKGARAEITYAQSLGKEILSLGNGVI